MTVESNSRAPVFSFVFPFRDVKGKEIVDEHAFHEWLASEAGGGFAVSNSGMWHGGIHISADGAGRQLDLEHGLRCMFKGEVIAYRANCAPLATRIAATGDSAAQIAHYSSAFTLVRHTLEYPVGNRLTLFSLYMHLQSVDEYRHTSMAMPAYWARSHEVTQHAADKQKTTSQSGVPAPQVGLNVHAAAGSATILGLLPHGARVRIGTRSRDGKWGKLDAIESGELIPPQVASYVREGAHAGWVYLGKERGHLLLEEVISDAQCDRVMVPASPVPIDAGDLIGHMGQYWQVADPARENRMAHIEVFCGDELHGFLTASRKSAKLLDFDERPLLRIDKGVKLFAGHSIDEEGATAPETAVIQIYSQPALDALPAQDKGPKDDVLGDGQPWWRVTSANSRYDDISGWVRNRQMPPNGGVTRETPHSWSDFETVTGSDGGNPTIFGTVDAWLDHMLCEDKPATGDIGKLKPLACSLYRALSPMRDESRAADEMRALNNRKWLSFRASRLIPRHKSEWASRAEYQGFFDKVLQRVTKEPYHDAEMERIAKLVWWDEVSNVVTGPFPSSPDVFHIHPVALAGNFSKVTDEQNEFTEKDAKEALQYIFEKYGRGIAETVERMYRTETRHFQSTQYRHCGTGGMEVHGSPPFYGWTPEFFSEPPTGTWSAFEGAGLSGSGGNAQITSRQKEFVVVSSVKVGMEFKAKYILKYNGNYAGWYSTDASAQELYRNTLQSITPRIVNSFN